VAGSKRGVHAHKRVEIICHEWHVDLEEIVSRLLARYRAEGRKVRAVGLGGHADPKIGMCVLLAEEE